MIDIASPDATAACGVILNLEKNPYEVVAPFTSSYIAAGGTLTFDTSPYPDYSLFILFALTGFVVFARYAASVSFTPHNVSGVTAETNGLKITFTFANDKNYSIIRVE